MFRDSKPTLRRLSWWLALDVLLPVEHALWRPRPATLWLPLHWVGVIAGQLALRLMC